MKGEVPKLAIVAVIALVVIVVGFFFWNATKPPEPAVQLPDASKMTTDDIAKMKEAEHAADQARTRQ